MKAYVDGFSLIGSHNLSASDLLNHILAHEKIAALSHANETLAVTNLDRIQEFFPARALRQLGHFECMALLGVGLALKNAQLDTQASKGIEDTAIILATGYGPAQPTFNFLNSVLDHGEGLASPLAFSHSVHNIPAAVIAQKLQIHGPCYTICQLQQPVYAALNLAISCLATGQVNNVIFIAIDEVTSTLLAIRQTLDHKKNHASPKLLTENAVCFHLTSTPTANTIGAFEFPSQDNTTALETPLVPRPAKTLAAKSKGPLIPWTEEPLTSFPTFVSGSSAQSAYTASTADLIYGATPVNQAVNMALALEYFKNNDLVSQTSSNTPSPILCRQYSTKTQYCDIAVSR